MALAAVERREIGLSPQPSASVIGLSVSRPANDELLRWLACQRLTKPFVELELELVPELTVMGHIL